MSGRNSVTPAIWLVLVAGRIFRSCLWTWEKLLQDLGFFLVEKIKMYFTGLGWSILGKTDGEKHNYTFFAHMPLIDIPILAVCRIFVPGTLCNGLSSYESPVAQCKSIQTCNRKVLASTPDRSTRNFFFRVCLYHYWIIHHSHTCILLTCLQEEARHLSCIWGWYVFWPAQILALFPRSLTLMTATKDNRVDVVKY